MSVFPVAVCTVATISFPDLRELGQKRASVALVGYYASAFFREKSICDVSCPESPAKSTCVAVIEFGGTSSGVAIVQSGSSGSISKFWLNAFTNVGYGCAATCSRFCGIKFAQFGVQYESLLDGRLLVKLVQRVILSFAVFKMDTPLQTLVGEWPEESLQIVDVNNQILYTFIHSKVLK
ncbi:MAG: hypothetical protein EZS28_002600 [Streblomastix strix]|uniref:Uncharacterized protein n=1 Tax=Streblomastix strix TaxID=222440 RepID=A0A5J4X509_9EUKA|nr:MAG: hypothetical protein EZS28_002600 [Streblomastix strix]